MMTAHTLLHYKVLRKTIRELETTIDDERPNMTREDICQDLMMYETRPRSTPANIIPLIGKSIGYLSSSGCWRRLRGDRGKETGARGMMLNRKRSK